MGIAPVRASAIRMPEKPFWLGIPAKEAATKKCDLARRSGRCSPPRESQTAEPSLVRGFALARPASAAVGSRDSQKSE